MHDSALTNNYICTITDITTLNLSNQGINVPTINLGIVEFQNKNASYNFYTSGNKLEFEPLVLEFLVSSDHKEWIDCYRWMYFAARNSDSRKYEKQVELTVYDSQSRRVLSYIYHNAIPTSLTGFRFTTKEDQNIIVSDITLSFERISVVLADGTIIDEDYINGLESLESL